MQPLANLKRYLAVLLILIVPAVILAAYFRNYSPGGGAGHAHSQASHAAMGHGGGKEEAAPGAQQAGAMPGMDHSKMGGAAPQAQPAPAGQPHRRVAITRRWATAIRRRQRKVSRRCKARHRSSRALR